MKSWTLVFDLDGTLVDTAPDLAAATNHVMRHLGLKEVPDSAIRPFVGDGALAMVDAVARSQGKVFSRSELIDLFQIFIAYYAENIANLSRAYAGVAAALDICVSEGATLAVCTNKLEDHARLLLDELKLTQYFRAITGRDSLDVFKPDPGHLTGTVTLAQGSSAKSLMIGDSETDVKTAKAANIPIIAVDFGYSTKPVATFSPNAIIAHYRELPAAVRKFTSAPVREAITKR